MNAIVSVTRDWGIGNKGQLLVRNPADMRFFRQSTTGGTVVVGRTTFEGFPHGPLPKRRNIVVSAKPDFAPTGAEVARDPRTALELVRSEEPDSVWLIGGARLYAELLDACEQAFVSKHEVVVPADTFFPNLDARTDWQCAEELASGTTPDGIAYAVLRYERV